MHGGRLCGFDEPGGVYRNRSSFQADDAVVDPQLPRAPFRTGEPFGAAGEVMTAELCLEGDDVGAKQPMKHFLSPREAGEQLDGRERDVQVEADGDVVPQVAQQSRYQL